MLEVRERGGLEGRIGGLLYHKRRFLVGLLNAW